MAAALVTICLVAAGAALMNPSPATADTVTATNTNPITIPATGTSGSASPYPSDIVVSGLAGTVTKVTVTLTNLSHTFPGDIDAMLVGPAGQNILFMSDAGGGADVNGVTLTFDDAAAGPLPSGQIASGTFQPTNLSDGLGGDSFNAPAPAPSVATGLLTFNGTDPNGTWSLYVMDDFGSDVGSLAGGWSLTIATQQAQVITFTSTAPSGAVVGDTYTPTATGGGSGNPVTFGASGACSYSVGVVTMNAVGTCTVTADQAGNADYLAAPQVQQVFSVSPGSGSLTIVKVTDPASDPQDFDFDMTGSGLPADLDVDTDAGDATLPSQQTFNLSGAQLGAHTVIESAVAGWTLTGLTCTGAGSDSSTDLGTGTANLDVDAGEAVVCTFTNTKAASLMVVKVTEPASDPQDFDFDLTGAGVPADLDLDTDAADATLPSQQTFALSAAQVGAYTIVESALVGWSLTNLGCTGAGADSSTNLATRVATLDIDAGETVVCTFTSTKAVPTAAPTVAPSLSVGAGTGGQTPTTPPTATERPDRGGSTSLGLVLWALLAIAALSVVASRVRPRRDPRRSRS